MLWIILSICLVLCIACIITNSDETGTIFGLAFLVTLIITCINLYSYNNIKTSCTKEITVLEENNTEILASIEPVIERYLNYESGTLKELKPNASTLIGLSTYPQLKGDAFVQSQLDIILKNNEEIKNRKLDLARLNSYKLWIFMGE